MTLYRANMKDGAVWITGASTGIGRELAIAMAKAGWTVAATARSADKLVELEEASKTWSGRILAFPADVTDAARLASVADAIEMAAGKIALVIFNAGNFWPASGDRLDVRKFADTYALNVLGHVSGLVPVVEKFKSRGFGHVMMVASVSGYSGLPSAAAYGASKAAVINMCEALKFDFDRMNIRIQVINPGFIETPLTQKNAFAMPALMPVDKAAARIVQGISHGGFELTFPKRFTWAVKLMRLLPYWLYFPLVKKITGAG